MKQDATVDEVLRLRSENADLRAANEIMTGALRAIAGETKDGGGAVWGIAQGALDIAINGSFEAAKQRGAVEH